MHQTEKIRAAHKTIGVFTSQQAAEQAMHSVSNLFGDPTRLTFIEPHDPALETKLKHEYSQTGYSAISIHVWAMIVSVLLGAAFWGYMYQKGVPMFVYEPWISFMGAVCVFLLIGVIVGFFVGYAPSRKNIITPTKNASEEGKWVVVAYPNSKAEANAAAEYFQRQ